MTSDLKTHEQELHSSETILTESSKLNCGSQSTQDLLQIPEVARTNTCKTCSKTFPGADELKTHEKECHKTSNLKEPTKLNSSLVTTEKEENRISNRVESPKKKGKEEQAKEEVKEVTSKKEEEEGETKKEHEEASNSKEKEENSKNEGNKTYKKEGKKFSLSVSIVHSSQSFLKA